MEDNLTAKLQSQRLWCKEDRFISHAIREPNMLRRKSGLSMNEQLGRGCLCGGSCDSRAREDFRFGYFAR